MPGWDRYDVPAHVQRAFDVPVLDRQRRQHHGAGRAARPPARRRRPGLHQGGTGIGAGIISGGALQRGAQGTAGDLGHVAVARRRRRRLPLRQRGLPRGGRRRTGAGRALRAAGRAGRDRRRTSSRSCAAATAVAVQVVRQAGRDIGEVVATLVNLINPSVIVIGGSMAEAGEHLLAGIREVVYQRSLPLATEHLRIVTSPAGERAGVLGAAALAIGHVLSPDAIEEASLRLIVAG